MAFDCFKPAESLIPNDGDLVFDSTAGDGGRSPTDTVLPYIEQRGEAADDGGIVINWTMGDGPPNGDTVGVIAIIAPAEHDAAGIEWTYFTGGRSADGGDSSGWICDPDTIYRDAGDDAITGDPGAHILDGGFVVDWTPGDGSGHDVSPIESSHPLESFHSGFDLVV
jgi:hypothetical protein